MPKLTSIIYCLFDFSRTLRHMSMASVSNIRRFTDQPYELIILDNVPKFPFRDDYKVLDMENINFVVNKEDKGYYGSLNQGAKLAKGEYLCFIQPDVFVHEGWLENAKWYLEHGYDVVFPDQFPQTREYITNGYKMSYDEAAKWGGREAGCVIMTREIFDKTGGWDDRLFNEFGEAAMYARLGKVGAKWTSTCKSLITHITAGTRYTMWDEDPNRHIADMARDGDMWGKIRNENK